MFLNKSENKESSINQNENDFQRKPISSCGNSLSVCYNLGMDCCGSYEVKKKKNHIKEEMPTFIFNSLVIY